MVVDVTISMMPEGMAIDLAWMDRNDYRWVHPGVCSVDVKLNEDSRLVSWEEFETYLQFLQMLYLPLHQSFRVMHR